MYCEPGPNIFIARNNIISRNAPEMSSGFQETSAGMETACQV